MLPVMTPEFAYGLYQLFLQEYAHESATTRKVLAAIPTTELDYAPCPKSTKAIDLAWHIANTEAGILNNVAGEGYTVGPRPAEMATPEAIVAFYDEAKSTALENLAKIPQDQWAEVITMWGVFTMPRAIFLGMAVKHTVHHRGQLSTYLRPMGGLVPAIYGGSADEPMSM